jgi:hypothetical protein
LSVSESIATKDGTPLHSIQYVFARVDHGKNHSGGRQISDCGRAGHQFCVPLAEELFVFVKSVRVQWLQQEGHLRWHYDDPDVLFRCSP